MPTALKFLFAAGGVLQAGLGCGRVGYDSEDTDGDGVPDVRDVWPRDPHAPFVLNADGPGGLVRFDVSLTGQAGPSVRLALARSQDPARSRTRFVLEVGSSATK